MNSFTFYKVSGMIPHSWLHAQKGISRVGLEAILLTLEHPFAKYKLLGIIEEVINFL